MSVSKEKAGKVLDVAIANCKRKQSINVQKPCELCKVHTVEVSKDTTIFVHGHKFKVGMDLCENCYDLIRCEVSDIDPDNVF